MHKLGITVQDTTGTHSHRPVTGGVPVAEGFAPDGTRFGLHDGKGEPVPLQTSVLARWKDGSARWVLLDFQANPSANGKQEFMLAYPSTGEQLPTEPIITQENPASLNTGNLSLTAETDALLNISDRLDVHLSVVRDDGVHCQAVMDETTLEVVGPMRATLSLAGAFVAADGKRLFQCRLRASVYSGLSMIRLEPLILVDADQGVLQHIRELKLSVAPRTPARSVRFGGVTESHGLNQHTVRLLQIDDEQSLLEGLQGKSDRAPGWVEFTDDQGTVAITLRDFWQQWPKSLEASGSEVSVGLFPRFQAGQFGHMEPWYKYQYLFEADTYQLRTGQARRWDIWIDLSGDGEALSEHADAPLLPVARPADAIATGVWDAIAPAGPPETQDYDPWAENLFNAYCHSIEAQRDYGAMNWGDWFGERRINWGNHEYDTMNQILIQFARTGDPKYFHMADAAARHSSEVDTIHFVNDDLKRYFGSSRNYPARPGMVHQHTVGHVSGFYDVDTIRGLLVEHGIGSEERPPYPCTDPFNLGHIWTQGMVRHYFLTGDPFLRETVLKIGDNLSQLVEDREYRFMGHTHCGRTTGWPLLALAGAYEIDLADRYVHAMRTLAEDALADQDPVCGGWLIHPMAGDHCLCKTARHTGMAGFITAVLINGLSRYYLLSRDGRLPQAIEKAVTFLDNDTWREEWQDWRYTSCPATRATGRPGVVVMAHVNGVRIADNPEQLRILQVAWEAKFERLLRAPKPGPGHGKAYSSTMYGCAEAIGLLSQRGSG